MHFAAAIGTGALAAVVLFSTAAHSQSEATRSERIAGDVIDNMAATAAFNTLRNKACSSEGARAQLGQAAIDALNCKGLAEKKDAGQAIPPRSFQEDTPVIEAAQGLWTTRDRASCDSRYYTWTVAGSIGMSEFKDQFGQLDVERTLEAGADTLLTETVASYHPVDRHSEVPGTRWRYLFVNANHVQVRNLTTGTSFLLTRCGG